jgi:hypothetical protein
MLLIGLCRFKISELTPNETRQFRILASYRSAIDWHQSVMSIPCINHSKRKTQQTLTQLPDTLAFSTPSRSVAADSRDEVCEGGTELIVVAVSCVPPYGLSATVTKGIGESS